MKVGPPPRRIGSGRQAISARPARSARSLILLGLLTASALFVAGGAIVRSQFPERVRGAIRTIAFEHGYGVYGNEGFIQLPARIAHNLADGAELPRIFIDIKFKHLRTLQAKRAEALRAGFLIQEDNDFVPATIRFNDRSIPVRLRMKGDMLDHLRGDRWSFRIHTRGDEQLFGMRRFSIQHPGTRGYQGEVLFHETLRRTGVLSLRYFFADVVVNGDDVGIMAVEEHFAKELLESNGRRDGVIIRFDESLLWAFRAARGRTVSRAGEPWESYLMAPIDGFQSTRIANSAQLAREQAMAVGLLRAFVDGQLSAVDVFDEELLGHYLAVAELWGAWHAVVWPNQRFYFNALTMKLEPIGFDANVHEGLGEGTNATPGTLAHRMLEDPQVRAAFERSLAALRRDIEDGELIAFLREVEARALDELRTEFVLLDGLDFDRLRARARRLPIAADRQLPIAADQGERPGPAPVHVLASTVDDASRSHVELLNPLAQEVEVLSMGWATDDGTPRPFESQSPVIFPLRLPASELGRRPAVVRLDFDPKTRQPGAWLEVRSRITNATDIHVARARQGYAAASKNPLPSGDIKEQLARNPFLSVDEDADVVSVRPGRWQVKGRIVVPAGFEFSIPAGTTLQFPRDGGLIVYGTTDFSGTETRPIVLEASSASSAGAAEWQGVVVHGAPGRSRWSFVTIRDTAGVDWSPSSLTGAVTFYRSDVTMLACTFRGNRAEDALNIIHSSFELHDVRILETASDGLDSDFSNGRISGGLFRDIGLARGADGLDVSGSTVDVDGTHFVNVTDKAISVGERSTVTARNIVAEHGGVGAVSKDHSQLDIRDSTIRAMRGAGLMSYVKKPEYGPATLLARNVRILDTANPAQAQVGSRLEVDGRSVTGRALDVERLYQTAMKPEFRQ